MAEDGSSVRTGDYTSKDARTVMLSSDIDYCAHNTNMHLSVNDGSCTITPWSTGLRGRASPHLSLSLSPSTFVSMVNPRGP